MLSYLICGARVVDPLNHVDAVKNVGIENGKIAFVGNEKPAASETIDCSGLVLMPGVIDPHLHLGSEFGSPYGLRMAAESGVTTCLDMAGPSDEIVQTAEKYGAGISVCMLEGFSPEAQFGTRAPSSAQMKDWIERSLEKGALGVKILGGHFPVGLETEFELVRLANERGAAIAWHAGSDSAGSNILGVREVIGAVGTEMPLHLAHINAYCRGRVNPVKEEVEEVLGLLRSHPNIWCESYLSPLNGTILTCGSDGAVIDHVTMNCLKTFGYPCTDKGIEAAVRDGKLFVIRTEDGMSKLAGGEDGIAYWRSLGTKTAGSFMVNPAEARFLVAADRREDGTFTVDSICTDGGCIPRNVILPMGLLLVKFGALTLQEFVQKASINAARHLRLPNKGHLSPGADADITVFDYEREKAVLTFSNGAPVLRGGKLVGRSAHFITTETGAPRLRSLGFPVTVVNPGSPEPARIRV